MKILNTGLESRTESTYNYYFVMNFNKDYSQQKANSGKNLKVHFQVNHGLWQHCKPAYCIMVGLDIIRLFQPKKILWFYDQRALFTVSLIFRLYGTRASRGIHFVTNTDLNLNEDAFYLKICLTFSLQTSPSCKIVLWILTLPFRLLQVFLSSFLLILKYGATH